MLHTFICWFILTPVLSLLLCAPSFRYFSLCVSGGVVTLFSLIPRGDAGVRDVDLCAVCCTVLQIRFFSLSRLCFSGSSFFWIWFLFFIWWGNGFLLIDLFSLFCFLLVSGVFCDFCIALLLLAAA